MREPRKLEKYSSEGENREDKGAKGMKHMDGDEGGRLATEYVRLNLDHRIEFPREAIIEWLSIDFEKNT